MNCRQLLNASNKAYQCVRLLKKRNGILFRALQRRINKDNLCAPILGKHAIFNPEQESMLLESILLLSNLFHCLIVNQLRKIALHWAETLNLVHNFNKENKMADWNWVQGFLKKNPRISIRKPEAISIQRITAFNENEVKVFF